MPHASPQRSVDPTQHVNALEPRTGQALQGMAERLSSSPRQAGQRLALQRLMGPGVVQRVRGLLKPMPLPATLALLEQIIALFDLELNQIDADAEEVKLGFIDAKQRENLQRWRQQYDEKMQALRDLAPGEAQRGRDEVSNNSDPIGRAMFDVAVRLNNMRKVLNESYEGYQAYLSKQQSQQATAYVEDEKYKAKNSDESKLARESEERKKQWAQEALARKKGLGNRWGNYIEDLKHDGTVTFHQHVPANAKTIEAAVRSGNILLAVYHTDKAFWIADPVRFKLGSAQGKACMKYTFSTAGAKSLVEDFLICGSGDFGDTNPVKYVGETQHPYFTIWKPNELGAYGVGSERLKELAGSVVKIEAEDEKGKPILFK